MSRLLSETILLRLAFLRSTRARDFCIGLETIKMKNKTEMTRSLCSECKVNGVILCTATKSRGGQCDKGALTVEEAKARKRRIDAMWQSYKGETYGKNCPLLDSWEEINSDSLPQVTS